MIKLVKTTFKFGFLVILLLLGMMIGITIAERGIYKVVGTPDSNSRSFQVSQSENQIEVMVLGESYVSDIPSSINKPKDEILPKLEDELEQEFEPEQEPVQEKINEPKFKTEPEKQPKTDSNGLGELGNAIGDLLQMSTEKGLNILAKMIE